MHQPTRVALSQTATSIEANNQIVTVANHQQVSVYMAAQGIPKPHLPGSQTRYRNSGNLLYG